MLNIKRKINQSKAIDWGRGQLLYFGSRVKRPEKKNDGPSHTDIRIGTEQSRQDSKGKGPEADHA